MLNHFRDRHPMGSIITDLVRVEEGIFIVKAQVLLNNTVIGTGLAGSTTVETAEDAALHRALSHAGFTTATLSLGLEAKSSLPLSSLTHTPSPLPLSTLTASSAAKNGQPTAEADPRFAWQPASIPPVAAIPNETASAVSSGAGSTASSASTPTEDDVIASPYGEPSYPPPEPNPPTASSSVRDPEDLSDIIAQSDVELKRIGWSAQEGRKFLETRFHKKSRHQLSPQEWQEFLQHLVQQPTRLRQESPF
jgi:hypothetical protein